MKEEKWEAIIGQIREFADSGVSGIIHGVTTDPVTGNEYIFSQIREILIMAVCGACIAFLFEVYEGIYAMAGKAGDKKRKWKVKKKTIRILLDFLFCAAAALIAARFWYISSCGRISIHEAAAMIGGIFAGRSVFLFKNSKPVRALAAVYVIMLITAYIALS